MHPIIFVIFDFERDLPIISQVWKDHRYSVIMADKLAY